MTNEIEKFVNIFKSSSVECKEDCTTCEKHNDVNRCKNMSLAVTLINSGVVIPVLCEQCGNYAPRTHTCKIKKDSWGCPLNRGPHDYCSDGTPKELSESKE